MLLAEENKRKSGLENVEFLKGEIENIPLPDNRWMSSSPTRTEGWSKLESTTQLKSMER
jgi:hypothetical protein